MMKTIFDNAIGNDPMYNEKMLKIFTQSELDILEDHFKDSIPDLKFSKKRIFHLTTWGKYIHISFNRTDNLIANFLYYFMNTMLFEFKDDFEQNGSIKISENHIRKWLEVVYLYMKPKFHYHHKYIIFCSMGMLGIVFAR